MWISIMEEEITLKVTALELDTLAQGLVELPFKVAQPMLEKLKHQFEVHNTIKAAVTSEVV